MPRPTAISIVDLHRPIGAIVLNDALSWEESRLVRRDWTVLWSSRWLQLSAENVPLELVGRAVTIREKLDRQIELLYRGRKLPFKELPAKPKRINPTSAQKASEEKRRGASNEGKEEKKLLSPWRRFGFAAAQAYWKNNPRVRL